MFFVLVFRERKGVSRRERSKNSSSSLISLSFPLTPVEAPGVLVPDVERAAVAVPLVAVAGVAVAVFCCC